jgi:solute:Na+ symporter, SSS family
LERLLPAAQHGLSTLDLAIVAAYLCGITWFGLRFRGQPRSLRNYFLGGKNISWWAIALSIVAAETSTLTVISIPGLAYETDLAFLQLVFGYLLARIVICLIFIPQYFRGEMFTAYELIERRFGPNLRSATAALFLVTRAAAEGVRVLAIAIVIGIALGRGEIASIAIITAMTLLYTFEGGLTAVIWTDVVQLCIYVAGSLIAFGTLLHLIPGGWTGLHAMAAEKFRVFDFSRSLATPYTFWAGIIGGTFLTMASHGTDQLMVQRLLAAKTERDSKKALLASGVAVLFQFTLFLVVGIALFGYYRLPSASFGKGDRIFPTFIVNELPRGMAGLLVAAVLAAAMSNLSAALNSLSTSSMVDFYLRWRPLNNEQRRTRLSRVFTAVWACILFALALLSRRGGRVLETGLSIASVAYGAMLGVFLLGILTKRANARGAFVGMVCGLAVNLFLWLAPNAARNLLGVSIAWTWYVTLGTIVTFAIGYAASLILPRSAHE